MDQTTIILIVFVSLSLVISIVSIVLISIALTRSSHDQQSTQPIIVSTRQPQIKDRGEKLKKHILPKKKSLSEKDVINSAPPIDQPVNVTAHKKIIKTPSKLLSKLKVTPRSINDLVNKLYVINSDGSKHLLVPNITEPILDVCKFNDGLLILLNFGNLVYIVRENDNLLEYQLPASMDITMLASFNESVVGLGSNGRIYNFNFYDEDNYEWEQIITSVKDATYINAPTSGDCLWLQTPKSNLCYDTTFDIIHKQDIKTDEIRIFGADSDEYIHINRSDQKGFMFGQGEETYIDDIYDGAFLDGELIKVSYDNFLKGVQKVRTIDGKLYYIINS